MSTEPMNLELEAIKLELAALKEAARLQSKLAFSVREAAGVTSIGEGELRNRIAAPEHSSLHVRVLRIGRRIVVPRSECERLLREQAR
jgi:hypothetical protein